MWNNENEIYKTGKLNSPSEGAGIGSTLLTTALDLGMKAAPIIGRKAVEAGRYYASEAMGNPKLQKKVIDYGMKKLDPFLRDTAGNVIVQLSTKVRPKKNYKTNRKDLDGGALARHRGHSSVDKAAYIMSNLLTPAPSFAGLAKVLAGQTLEGGIIDSLLTSGVKR